MKFKSKLIKATISKRYKRFLSDVVLENGTKIIAYVPNTGSMKMCWGKNWPVFLSKNNNPKRKYKYTLEMTDSGKSLIGINTMLTNKLAREAIENGIIKELQGYKNIKAETKIGNSRIDFLLESKNKKKCYVEVKNVTLLSEDYKYLMFPDAITTRGQKHLLELMSIKKNGDRAVMLFVAQREESEIFIPAKKIDPKYAKLLIEAKIKGVEILVYGCSLTEKEIKIERKLKAKI